MHCLPYPEKVLSLPFISPNKSLLRALLGSVAKEFQTYTVFCCYDHLTHPLSIDLVGFDPEICLHWLWWGFYSGRCCWTVGLYGPLVTSVERVGWLLCIHWMAFEWVVAILAALLLSWQSWLCVCMCVCARLCVRFEICSSMACLFFCSLFSLELISLSLVMSYLGLSVENWLETFKRCEPFRCF